MQALKLHRYPSQILLTGLEDRIRLRLFRFLIKLLNEYSAGNGLSLLASLSSRYQRQFLLFSVPGWLSTKRGLERGFLEDDLTSLAYQLTFYFRRQVSVTGRSFSTAVPMQPQQLWEISDEGQR
jgi:hypothetical protein